MCFTQWMRRLSRPLLEAAARSKQVKQKRQTREDVTSLLWRFRLPQKTIGIINISKQPNWSSLTCRCGCCVLSVSCRHPPHQLRSKAPLTEADSSQTVKFNTGRMTQNDSNSITMIPVIINRAAGNIGICSAQTDKASLSMDNIPYRLHQLHQMFELFGSWWSGRERIQITV